jgi:histidinol-phosphatase
VTPDIDDDLALALRLADAADEISLGHFTGDAVAHDLKADGSPVSAADIAVERRICELLAEERPGDGVLGEEVGEVVGEEVGEVVGAVVGEVVGEEVGEVVGAVVGEVVGEDGPEGRRWILDGIDGTVLFVAGRLGWATEIALEVDGEVLVGVSTCPIGGRRYWAARGRGAWRAGAAGGADRVRVSDAGGLAGGRYSAIPPIDVLDPGRRAVAERLGEAGAAWVPPVEHGALFVADGRANACIQLGGGPWDFAALAAMSPRRAGRSAT